MRTKNRGGRPRSRPFCPTDRILCVHKTDHNIVAIKKHVRFSGESPCVDVSADTSGHLGPPIAHADHVNGNATNSRTQESHSTDTKKFAQPATTTATAVTVLQPVAEPLSMQLPLTTRSGRVVNRPARYRQ